MATETVTQAISDIRKQFPDMDGLDNEEDVKLFVIERILEALDWNLRRRGEVKKEYRVGKDRADYALNPDLPTAVFIEVKKPAVHLENHERQLLNYCVQQAVNLAVLTNGRIWWLYLPEHKGPQGESLRWSQKRFSEIDITSGGPAKIAKEFEKFLSKERVSSGEAVESAKGEIEEREARAAVRKEMVETWNTVLTAPSEGLINLLTESTPSLRDVKPNNRQGLVKEFFQNHRAQFKVSHGGPPPPKPPTNGGIRRQNGKPSSFTFKDTTDDSVRTWKEVLVKLCKLIYADPNRQGPFDQIMSVRGTKNLYFSRNRDDLSDSAPESIGDSGVFAATTSLNADQVERRCRKVLKEFRYPDDSFKIE